MKLQINDDYRISSDSSNVMLEKKRIAKTGKNAGEEQWDVIGYYGKIEWALSACVKHGLMEQDLKGLNAIMNYLACIHQDIKNLADRIVSVWGVEIDENDTLR